MNYSLWRFTTYFNTLKASLSPTGKRPYFILFTFSLSNIFSSCSVLLDSVTRASGLTWQHINRHTNFNIFMCTGASSKRSQNPKEVIRLGTSMLF